MSAKASLRLAGLADGKMSSYIRQQQDAVSLRQRNHKKTRNVLDPGQLLGQHGTEGFANDDPEGQSTGSRQALWLQC